MKKLLYLIAAIAVAISITACSGSADNQGSAAAEPDSTSKAAQSKWDFYIIGSWLYAQEDTTQDYNKGVETFHGSGEYINHTQDAKGNRAILTGTWRVNNDKDYTLDITITSLKNAEGEKNVDIKQQYTIAALEPGATLSYVVDGKTPRTAAFTQE